MKKLTLQFSAGNYSKALARLLRNISSGRFAGYTQRKKQQVWKRLCRYAKQLGIRIKAPVAAACVAAGLSLATPAQSQVSLTEQTGASNPFDGISVGAYAAPAFVDIDGDGDIDAFIGDGYGGINYYKNTGTATAPVFTAQTGASNPFDGVSVGSFAAPTFADLVGDGDLDAFIGAQNGTISYYKNTGTATVPVFTVQTGASNPLDGVVVNNYSRPAFADVDGDGDKDVFIGSSDGTVSYYKNTGTASVPVFTVQTGSSNPFDGVDLGGFSVPAFADIDGDGDLDALISANNNGTISYFKNTGTAAVPVFTAQSGANNPFDGLNVGYYLSTPAFADIDGDGNMDVFVGINDGSLSYFKNTSILLPLRLLGFNGSIHSGYNQLQWKTADEVNTQQFELESGNDGTTFTKIASVNAVGTGSNDYSYSDKKQYSGKVFYRLKMVDIDGRFTYSNTISLNGGNTRGITIYPNPAKDVVVVTIGNTDLLGTTATIYNTSGWLIQNIVINKTPQQLNVGQLPSGMYFIKFADGSVRRFIK